MIVAFVVRTPNCNDQTRVRSPGVAGSYHLEQLIYKNFFLFLVSITLFIESKARERKAQTLCEHTSLIKTYQKLEDIQVLS